MGNELVPSLNKYGRIMYPRNDQRSASAWRKIGYRVRSGEPAIGWCRVQHYGTEYDVWDSSQVEPIPGKPAQKRREQYHEYLFRRRMYDKRYAVHKQFMAGVDNYEIWLTDFVDDMQLWALGVLIVRPANLEYIAQCVLADCRKSEYPQNPVGREYHGYYPSYNSNPFEADTVESDDTVPF